MRRRDSISGGPTPTPTMSPLLNLEERSGGGEERWRHFDNSVNAVSFGFVATAILISMFLLMAIFERFLRPRSSFAVPASGPRTRRSPSSASPPPLKLDYPSSPKMSIYAKGVSVLMPGNDIPTFIAHPAPPPAPCPPERILWPPHHPIPIAGSASSSG